MLEGLLKICYLLLQIDWPLAMNLVTHCRSLALKVFLMQESPDDGQFGEDNRELELLRDRQVIDFSWRIFDNEVEGLISLLTSCSIALGFA